MDKINDLAASAKSALYGTSNEQSDQEPPSGVTGKGTSDSPYDQGNAPEPVAGRGIEPVSGEAGQGTADKPYDQGNQAENTEPNSNATSSTPPSVAPQIPAEPEVQSANKQNEKIEEQRGRTETAHYTTSTSQMPVIRTTDTTVQGSQTDATQTSAADEAIRSRKYERSCSPGQLDDGTHVRTSGERGATYEPGKKLGDRLKGKFHFGRSH